MLNNALATLQRAIEVMHASVRRQFVLVYLDDIFLFSESPKDHSEQVRRVLRPMITAAISLKFREFKLLPEAIDFLGHVMRPDPSEHA